MTLELLDTVEFSTLEIRSEDGRHYIEGIAVPWSETTMRAPTPEVFERGAFGDLVASGAKVKLTAKDHEGSYWPVGYSTAVEDRDAGLFMRFKMNNTPQGRDALENALEDVYGGLSVGFIARADEMRGGVRHVTSARLDHVSLAREPAYDGARILSVRAADDAETTRLRALIANSPTRLDTSRQTAQNLLESIISRRA
jgi:HK97 family phage prohead protease